MTCRACSTPCSAKYCASALSRAQSAATSALTVSRPSAGGQSMRMRSCSASTSLQRLAQDQLAPHLARHRQLGLGQRQVGGDDPVALGRGGVGAPGEDVADRRGRLGIDVEVVRQVALRIEVDHEDVEPRLAEDVGQRADSRRLAGAALLGEDRDLLGHSRDSSEGRVKANRRAERARNPASPSPSVLSSAGLPGPKLSPSRWTPAAWRRPAPCRPQPPGSSAGSGRRRSRRRRTAPATPRARR